MVTRDTYTKINGNDSNIWDAYLQCAKMRSEMKEDSEKD